MGVQWILRQGTPSSGFRYRRADGPSVRDARTLERIRKLVIPPAWRDVHIDAKASAPVQAWGIDARGRKQYRYHARATARGSLRKYHRVRQMARDLPAIRAAVERDFRRRDLSRERVAAGVVRLLERGCLRIGGERYAEENKTFGITTLRKSHASVEGDCVRFSYIGKRNIRQRQTVVDAMLARFVRQLQEMPGRRLFRYQDAGGHWKDLTSRDVNVYLREVVGHPYTGKDFRTWGGTLRVATVLAELGDAASEREAKRNVITAVRLAAAELGNTPTICRSSYVHPIVIERYLEDQLTIGPALARLRAPGRWYLPEERALLRFLDKHFPERRRRRRTAKTADAA